MFHAGDLVRIKGQNATEGTLRVVRVDGDVAMLRYLGASLQFSEHTRNLNLVQCGCWNAEHLGRCIHMV